MIVLGWIAIMVAAFGVALLACQRALLHLQALAFATRVPPFVIGVTLVAIGTDLPEIANSIASCLAGHGDLNVGDSIGSAVTQATLVLGLLPLIVGAFNVSRRRVATAGIASLVGLLIGIPLVADGFLSRSDGVILFAAWAIGSWVIFRNVPAAEPVATLSNSRIGRHAVAALAFLALIGAGAAVAVRAFVELSVLLGVPEYILSFFVASIGTSLPELLVDVSALRRGLKDLAVGDILGSTFVDATLSVAAGVLIAPTAVTGDLAVRGAATAFVVIAAATALLAWRRRHGVATGVALLGLYALLYPLLLVG